MNPIEIVKACHALVQMDKQVFTQREKLVQQLGWVLDDVALPMRMWRKTIDGKSTLTDSKTALLIEKTVASRDSDALRWLVMAEMNQP
jgi:hypothetical protein